MLGRTRFLVPFLFVLGCKDPPAPPVVVTGSQPVAPIGPRVTAADLDLNAVASLLRDGQVRDGAALQKALNRDSLSRVDADRDGRRDRLQVIERRVGPHRYLDIRALPSGRSLDGAVGVPVAVLEFEPQDAQALIKLYYADGVIGAGPPIAFTVPLVLGSFAYWVLIVERPLFVGVIEVHHVQFKGKHKHFKWH